MARSDEHQELVELATRSLATIREQRPYVHCLTNPVAQHISANILLSAGAIPSLTADAESIEEFVSDSNALVVNLGMLDATRKQSILIAIGAASKLGRPWLLDPVKVEHAATRRDFANQLIAQAPSVIRCNLAEEAALGLSDRAFLGVVAVTGACDRITQGEKHIGLLNGNPIMDRVTAMGCAASALTGAFLAVENDPWVAAMASLLIIGIAGDISAETCRGPGSFEAGLLDALFTLSHHEIEQRAKLQ